MLYSFQRNQPFEYLSPLKDLSIKENDDPSFMSALAGITTEEATRRLANDHKAYVAYFKNIPAAFGWMAMGKARVGELNHELILPTRHRYLWNFRTVVQFRGYGIYPRLLQHILTVEADKADMFWIMHAPENEASRKGIIKAGFTFRGRISVQQVGNVIFEAAENVVREGDMIDSLGFRKSAAPQATCWSCSSPYLAQKKTACCCATNNRDCNAPLFTLEQSA
jgi:hypothetical protein